MLILACQRKHRPRRGSDASSSPPRPVRRLQAGHSHWLL